MLSCYRHCLDLRETKNANKSRSKIMTEVETKKKPQKENKFKKIIKNENEENSYRPSRGKKIPKYYESLGLETDRNQKARAHLCMSRVKQKIWRLL